VAKQAKQPKKRKPQIDPAGLRGPEWEWADELSLTTGGLPGSGDDLWKGITEHIERPAKSVPVVHDVDVVVVGGGVAGTIAAIAAARHGAATLVVDEFSSLGGNMGVGLWAGGSVHLSLSDPNAFPNGIGGIPGEFAERAIHGENRMLGQNAYFRDAQAVKTVAIEMLEAAGGQVFLNGVFSDVLLEGGAVVGLFVETKSGTMAIRSKVVIDCTGTADVADRAGAPVIVRPTHPSAGVFFAVANVEYGVYEQALTDRGDLSDDDKAWAKDHEGARPYMPWARQAWEADEFYIIDVVGNFATLEISMKPPTRTHPGMQRGRTRVNGNWNPGDALALSRINQRMHPYIYHFVEFLRHRVPGYQNANLHIVSPFTHSRGGKCIEAEYTVTGDDVTNDARFDDVVYKFWGPSPAGCDIPYRAMIPKKIDGLMAAGRSAMNRGPQFRSRYSCQLMGQAAGVAAAMAVKHGVQPRAVDVKELQRALHTLGANMGPEERLKELGLL
jgi:hypothetical protein